MHYNNTQDNKALNSQGASNNDTIIGTLEKKTISENEATT